MAGVRGKNLSARADGVDGDGPTLPAKLAPDGLLIGYSLEEEAHRPVMGFRFGEAVEDENADDKIKLIRRKDFVEFRLRPYFV